MQLPSHTTTLETVNCFVAPFAEKNPSFPDFPGHALFFSLLEDAAVFPSQAQMSNCRKLETPVSTVGLTRGEEMRKAEREFCGGLCSGSDVFLKFRTSSLK